MSREDYGAVFFFMPRAFCVFIFNLVCYHIRCLLIHSTTTSLCPFFPFLPGDRERCLLPPFSSPLPFDVLGALGRVGAFGWRRVNGASPSSILVEGM